ncbi:MAG TPA: hypothetical protein VK543_09505 [Puia sp.]|nr:hypothetical protein [Puia sp.]
MKLRMNAILEALFNPKPNDHLKRNPADDYQYGHGLILIPVPNQSNREERLNQETTRR